MKKVKQSPGKKAPEYYSVTGQEHGIHVVAMSEKGASNIFQYFYPDEPIVTIQKSDKIRPEYEVSD